MEALAVPLPPSGATPAGTYLARLAPSSRRVQLCALTTLARILWPKDPRDDVELVRAAPWGGLRYEHTIALRGRLQGAPATINRQLAALRGVLREAWRLGLMSAEDYERAKDIPAARGKRLPAGRALEEGERRSMYLAARAHESNEMGIRDQVLLSVAYMTGLRRHEIAALDLEDIDLKSGRVDVRHGKGDKERIVWLRPEELGPWLKIRGKEPGALFYAFALGPGWNWQMTDRRLSAEGIYAVVVRKSHEAGIDPVRPHDLRRTHASDLLRKSGDLAAVQRLMGHASPSSTVIYDLRPEEAGRDIARLLVP